MMAMRLPPSLGHREECVPARGQAQGVDAGHEVISPLCMHVLTCMPTPGRTEQQGVRAWLTPRGQGQGADDGHEDAPCAGSGARHGRRQQRFSDAEAVREAQSASAHGPHEHGGHALPQARFLEPLPDGDAGVRHEAPQIWSSVVCGHKGRVPRPADVCRAWSSSGLWRVQQAVQAPGEPVSRPRPHAWQGDVLETYWRCMWYLESVLISESHTWQRRVLGLQAAQHKLGCIALRACNTGSSIQGHLAQCTCLATVLAVEQIGEARHPYRAFEAQSLSAM